MDRKTVSFPNGAEGGVGSYHFLIHNQLVIDMRQLLVLFAAVQ
jgi:hypothetical protein